MKYLKAIWVFFEALGKARHAAFLARQGKVNEAKQLYKF